MERSTKLATLVFSGLVAFSAMASAEETSLPIHEEVQLIEGEGVRAGIVTTQIVTRTAKVTEVHYVNRTLVLEAKDGEVIKLDVNEEAKNFSSIQTDDLVTVEYLESVALFATEKGLVGEDGVLGAVAMAAEGEMPGGLVTETVKISASVEAIDYDTRTITLKSPEGTKVMQVDESAKRFNNIKKGDEVHFVYTTAVAISVQKAASNIE
jgi:Cu/Ag efflux protein CusF